MGLRDPYRIERIERIKDALLPEILNAIGGRDLETIQRKTGLHPVEITSLKRGDFRRFKLDSLLMFLIALGKEPKVTV